MTYSLLLLTALFSIQAHLLN